MSIRRPRKSSPQRSGRIPDRAHPRDKGSRSRKVTANFVVEGHSMTNQVPENAHLTLHERLNPASYVPSTSLPKSLTFHAKQGSDALSAQPWPCFRRIHSREDSPLVINWALTPGFPLKKLTFDSFEGRFNLGIRCFPGSRNDSPSINPEGRAPYQAAWVCNCSTPETSHRPQAVSFEGLLNSLTIFPVTPH